ncbi:MAG: hypothetical protein B6I28_05400 [Fusobacteriia bacterium 4572_132]|nr:MAG: hypothetical protein B6I28_05400 [Fusobacteriia bacterium 4572_132]
MFSVWELITYNLTNENEVLDRIKEAEIIITNKVYIGKNEMEVAKNLKLVCVAATGYNNVDIEEAKQKNIVVANVKNYSTESVAQTVFAYILEFYNKINRQNEDVKKGKWEKSPIFTMLNHTTFELKNKKIGIIGYGKIGKRVGEIAKVFGMKILVAKRKGVEYKENFRYSLEEILKESDIVTIHTPLTKESFNMIGKKELELMKKDSFLINTARGGIINEEELYFALKNKKIKGGALDVMVEEPPKSHKKLFELDNIIITPHIAWASKESREKLIAGIVDNIREFKKGKIEKINIWRK